jgi:Domain of unknown function (DUF4396)
MKKCMVGHRTCTAWEMGVSEDWLEQSARGFILLSLVCAFAAVADLFRRPQKMWVMNLVWPLTVLYGGPLGLWLYWWIGRRPLPDEESRAHGTRKPFWAVALTGSTHCGAGCAVGDFIGEWIVFATGFTLLGSVLLGKFAVAFVLAYLFGIFFQYFSIAPMRGLSLWPGLQAAVKADTLSLVAYQIGMFAWMAVTQKILFPGLQPTTWLFWAMMQVAMVLGLATTFPVNWWLIKRGIKEAM